MFQVSKILATISPPLFQLKNLLGKAQPGYFYQEQLTLTEKPKPGHFLIEKILHKKKVKGSLLRLQIYNDV